MAFCDGREYLHCNAPITHGIAWCTVTLASDTVTHPSVHAQAGFQTAVAVVTMCASLVAVKPSPTALACAFSFERVTAGMGTRKSQKSKKTWSSTQLMFERLGSGVSLQILN